MATTGERSSGWTEYLKALGPGLVTGASDDDPSGIATYAQAGAMFGLGMAWTALVTFPLMATVQETCDRTALATGKTLGELAALRFTRRWRHVIVVLTVGLLVANLINVAADLVAVGEGMELLHAGPSWLWALLAGVMISILLVVGTFERIARILKILCLSLLSYVVVLFLVHPAWGSVLGHLLLPRPTWSREYLALLVAVLGTTISPYLFFWESAQRVEDMRKEPAGGSEPEPLGRRSKSAARLKQRHSRVDVFAGMAFSNLVMLSIIVATAATLGAHGGVQVQSAAQAAQALEPLAGTWSSTVFALGFIGTGMLAVPVLAASGAVGLAGLFHRDWGLSEPFRRARLFYTLLLVGTVGGTALSVVGIDPIRLLVISAFVNGLAAAPFLVVLMLIARDRQVMGRYANGRVAGVLGWTTVALMSLSAIAVLISR
jgi:NRAMP (natural resistance-associated macrophage protein)-like metal ion transporter